MTTLTDRGSETLRSQPSPTTMRQREMSADEIRRRRAIVALLNEAAQEFYASAGQQFQEDNDYGA